MAHWTPCKPWAFLGSAAPAAFGSEPHSCRELWIPPRVCSKHTVIPSLRKPTVQDTRDSLQGINVQIKPQNCWLCGNDGGQRHFAVGGSILQRQHQHIHTSFPINTATTELWESSTLPWVQSRAVLSTCGSTGKDTAGLKTHQGVKTCPVGTGWDYFCLFKDCLAKNALEMESIPKGHKNNRRF